MKDKDFLREAIKEGNKKAKPFNFGAVIVKDGKIIASEYNHVHEEHDPTLHAETSAIKAACKKLKNHNITGCTMYGSHEPCLMCFSCAAWAGIERIVFAVPASEVNDFSYEFSDVSIRELAEKLTDIKMKVELIRVD